MQGSFYGWYFKCQSDTQTLAVIPAIHRIGKKYTCSIQIITNDGAWTVNLSNKIFRRTRKRISIGKNRFEKYGIRLAVQAPGLSVRGKMNFGQLAP